MSVPVVALVLGTSLLVAGCSGTADTAPTRTRSASAVPSGTGSPSGTPSTGSPAGSASAAAGTGADDGTGTDASGSDGSGATGTGTDDTGSGGGDGTDGSSDDAAPPVDVAAVSAEGVAAAGGGTVVSFSGSGVGTWTVVVAAPDGTETQSVVTGTQPRVVSGPFPRTVDDGTRATNIAVVGAARVDPAAASAAATRTVVGGTVASMQLVGTAAAPRWTVTVTAGGAAHVVTVDAVSGTVLSRT